MRRDAGAGVPGLVGQCRLTLGVCSRPHACFQLLKPKHDKLLSNVAFNFNLRHYRLARDDAAGGISQAVVRHRGEVPQVEVESNV